MNTQEEALQFLRDNGVHMPYDAWQQAYKLNDLYPVLKLLQKLTIAKEPIKYCKNRDDRMPESPPELVATYTERYEKAEKLLDDLLSRAAKQYSDGGERKSAKIGVMKAIILQWAARETDCMDSLEYQATH